MCFCLQAVERVLFPHLPAYWANLQAVLDDYSVSNAQVKADGHKVYGAILVSTAVNLTLPVHLELLLHFQPLSCPVFPLGGSGAPAEDEGSVSVSTSRGRP